MATRRKDPQLESALAMIESIRSSQMGGIQALGANQDQNIQNIYGTLRGGLQQGVSDTQSIYDRGQQNIRSAYGLSGQQAAAANASGMSQIADRAGMMGMDQNAVSSVQSRLAQQAGLFAGRNAQSQAERLATMAEQGAGHTAIAQMAVEAARHAEARGRSDLSKKIMAEVAKANSTAMQSRAGVTEDAANRSAQLAAEAQRSAQSTMAELVREQRAIQREERAEARRAAREDDPLDRALKMARLEQLMGGGDEVGQQIKALNLEKLLEERENRRGESQADVFDYIRRTFPNQGNKSIPALQKAWMKGVEAKDDTGATARSELAKEAKKHNLNLDVLYDMLRRLEAAAGRR